MFQHILVPLDGSPLAETALKPAIAVSQRCGGVPIMLVHIIEKDAPTTVHGQRHLQTEAQAGAYLQELLGQVPAGIPAEYHIHTEEVANIPRSIVAHTQELNQDLVVMCSHGRGGPRDWAVGSIAQQVIGLGQTPVLLINAETAESALYDFSRVMVAVDLEPGHRAGLAAAQAFAQNAQARLHLLTVVPTAGDLRGQHAASGRLSPSATAAFLDVQAEQTQNDLAQLAADSRSLGVQVSFEVRRGDPAREIVRGAEDDHAGVIVLGTHGRAGLSAFWAGSVAPRLPGMTAIPLMLVPSA